MKSEKQGISSGSQKSSQPFFHKSGNGSFFSPETIQRKLTIGQPNDKYEQEADAMAEKVVSRSTASTPSIQQQCAECEKEKQILPMLQREPLPEEEELQMKPEIMRQENDLLQASPDLESKLSSTKGGGQALSPSVQAEMNSSFGADFSGVRVHSNTNAAQMSQSIQAQAFTNGSDIYFNHGKYNPESSEGKKLLAHELTHTVQQGAVK
ncbi:MAG: DUF4157 domain-containing protein [Bacteroidia bacterium]